jgi:hypothetical protein
MITMVSVVRPIPDAARVIRVSLPGVTFGLAVIDGQVVAAAPVAGGTLGRPEAGVAAYYKRRGAQFTDLGKAT